MTRTLITLGVYKLELVTRNKPWPTLVKGPDPTWDSRIFYHAQISFNVEYFTFLFKYSKLRNFISLTKQKFDMFNKTK